MAASAEGRIQQGSNGIQQGVIEPMFDDLPQTERRLRNTVEALEPDVLEPDCAAHLVEVFSHIERLGAAGKALAARRVAYSGVWRRTGERSAAQQLPATDRALRDGNLSETQAIQIASAAAQNPSSEDELLTIAFKEGVTGLMERCAHVRAAAVNEAARHDAFDHSALVRGRLNTGETCETREVGPVSVAAARAFASDAVVAALVTDYGDVRSVTHFGRTIPARLLRTALQERDPTCVVPGCLERRRLEIDHIVPLSEGGPTSLDNLARLCRWHHHQKTHKGYKLRGGPGNWRWERPRVPVRSRIELKPERTTARE